MPTITTSIDLKTSSFQPPEHCSRRMAPSPDSKSSPIPSATGVKRRAVSLLPPFDPLSSSPALPRPMKRSRDAYEDSKDYPTPLPTSSTAILASSPPQNNAGSALNRSVSALSERGPLSALRTIYVTDDGKPVLMGRSSVSSHFQLSANRSISRVHARAFFVPAGGGRKDRVEIHCDGWNGLRVHCSGKICWLLKGEHWFSEDRNADIMLEVADTRVMIRWPGRKSGFESTDTESALGDENSPRKSISPIRRRSFTTTSPLRQRQRIASPVSPSPAVHAALAPSLFLQQPPSSPPPIVIYEDSESADEIPQLNIGATQQSTQVLTQPSRPELLESSQSLEQKESQSLQTSAAELQEDFSDHDEENDPIIHSFGPFGANLLSGMESFQTNDSPRVLNQASSESTTGPSQTMNRTTPPMDSPQQDLSQTQSHIINQLAFSRLSSTPLSTIISNLPDSQHQDHAEIKTLITNTKCIGEVAREGKDAAGKPL